jgi:hypothetical protein
VRLNDGLREVQCCHDLHALLSTCLAPDPVPTHLVTTHTRVQVLADPQMRREVVPGLPLHRVCQLLERFQPDENAPDPLLPGQLSLHTALHRCCMCHAGSYWWPASHHHSFALLRGAQAVLPLFLPCAGARPAGSLFSPRPRV